MSNTVKPLSPITSLKQHSPFKSQHSVIPNVHMNSKLTCNKQSPGFKGHFNLSIHWLFKTGLPKHNYVLVTFQHNTLGSEI